jgi:hypothetical protein
MARFILVVLAVVLSFGCSAGAPETGEPIGSVEQRVAAPAAAYCSIDVQGKGVLDLENDYLPHVIQCENGGANLQALKAQAIAARSVAYYGIATSGSICDGQGCQVYSCGATPSALHHQAVKETAGMYLSYAGTLTYGFYVAGGNASPPGCHGGSASTEHYVTYNAGKSGGSVEQTTLGYVGPPGFGQNRGCMSQLGARCLEQSGKDAFAILRFYYGEDIKVTTATGPCVQGCEAQCAWDGNLINEDCSVTKCAAVGASCVDDSKGLRCASVFCVDNGTTQAKDVCLPDGEQAHCTSQGGLENIEKCDAGLSCVPDGDGTRCGIVCKKEPVSGAEGATFHDVPPDSFGADAAEALHDAGIASGCQPEPPLFCPGCELSRGAIVKWLVDAAKLTLVSPATPTFSDVPTTHPFYAHIETAAAAGIVSGYDNGEFRPALPATRASGAVMIQKASGLAAPSPLPKSFADVDEGAWFHESIEALKAGCITSGCDTAGTKYCPTKILTRRAGAVMISRAFDLIDSTCELDPPDETPELPGTEPEDPPSTSDDDTFRGGTEEDEGCSMTAGRASGSPFWILGLVVGVALLRKRGALVLVLGLFGCNAASLDDEETCDGESVSVGTVRETLSSIDCNESTDTGYTQGNPFPITVVTVDGKKVERETANAYYVMAQAAAAGGVNLQIISGFRTMSEQEYLYGCYINCSCNNCNQAAKPGHSNHQSGHALDLNSSAPGVQAWLNAHGAQFGFSATVSGEPWHWEWWGGGPGGGPCKDTCVPQCAWDGNLINEDCSVTKCAAVGASCVDDSKGLRCASVFCVDNGTTAAKDVCLPDGEQAHCTSKGALENIEKCDTGLSCVPDGDGTRCGIVCKKESVKGAESATFHDVPPDSFGADAAEALHDAGIASGCQPEPPLFCPGCELSRGAIVKWLVDAAKLTLVSPATPTFSDVPKTHPFYAHIETAAAAGIVSGYDNGEFRPALPATRASGAVMIQKASGLTAPSPLPKSFADVDAGAWFHESVEALKAACITSGCDTAGTKYCPTKILTRRAGAVMISRAFDLIDSTCELDPPDETPELPGDEPEEPAAPEDPTSFPDPSRGGTEEESGCSTTPTRPANGWLWLLPLGLFILRVRGLSRAVAARTDSDD